MEIAGSAPCVKILSGSNNIGLAKGDNRVDTRRSTLSHLLLAMESLFFRKLMLRIIPAIAGNLG
jgi:hypothetical protein